MDAESLRELFREFGAVDVRRMFGGQGLFADGVMIALVTRGEIFLKADSETIAAFEQEGQRPFSYATKKGEQQLTSYWRMPERLYDDTDELARWARLSLAAAHRAKVRPRQKLSTRPPKAEPSAKPKRKVKKRT